MARILNIQIRRDTAANWTAVNPILSIGELGVETNTRKMKCGDGATAWTALAYMWDDASLTITDTYSVADQAGRLASGASKGDVAIQADTAKAYILATEPATVNANWTEFPVPLAASTMTGATAVLAGTGGIVPVPGAGTQNSFLTGGATYTNVMDGGTA